MIRLRTQLRIDDYGALDTHHWSRPAMRALLRRVFWRLMVAWCAFTLAFVWWKGAFAVPETPPQALAAPLGFLVLTVVMVGLAAPLRPAFARWNLRPAFRGAGAEFLAPLTYEVDDRSVRVRSPNGVIERETLTSVEATPDHMVLFFGPRSAIILPRRDQPAEALDAFRAAAQALVRPFLDVTAPALQRCRASRRPSAAGLVCHGANGHRDDP